MIYLFREPLEVVDEAGKVRSRSRSWAGLAPIRIGSDSISVELIEVDLELVGLPQEITDGLFHTSDFCLPLITDVLADNQWEFVDGRDGSLCGHCKLLEGFSI